jgi:Zn-dependent peptidase ImmA (M78 family)
MRALQMQAIKKAGQIRAKLKVGLFDPINIFDTCAKLKVNVRFVPVSMEGLYISYDGVATSEILLSSLRPFPRRVYNCGHELGHHIFGHGSKIDGLSDDGMSKAIYDDDEYLVDTFAGALLMPVAAIQVAFEKRKWNFRSASPIQFYTVSSEFGVGYSTLITHCKVGGLLNQLQADALLKMTPARLLNNLIGQTTEKSHFKVIDEITAASVIDIETGNYLFLPESTLVEGKNLSKLRSTEIGDVFTVMHPGIVRVLTPEKAFFIRIQNAGYVGLAEHRHTEEKHYE